MKNNPISLDFSFTSSISTPRSKSPASKSGEAICNKYLDIIKSNSNILSDSKPTDPLEKPFDFFDDEEYAFGINLLNNNVACVGENMTKLIQMAQEPWPHDVKLFQPYEVEQILLPDNASCLAVQAFLKMCNLPFEVEMRWNSEFMSPSGRVPFIKCGAFVVSELEPIVQFAANKGVSLCGKMSGEERAEMRAYMSLITNVLVNAELYISWLDDETYNTVTKVRNSSVYPWPLGWFQTRSKRIAVAKRLKALNWHDKTLDQVLADVEQCCNSLSQRLGDKDFFFGSPTPLDVLLFGHLVALLRAPPPRGAALRAALPATLLAHTKRMAEATGMALTLEEDQFIKQIQITKRVPDRMERNARARSKVLRKNFSQDLIDKERDVFGFKPFASQQIIVMSTKESNTTIDDKKSIIDEDRSSFVHDIIGEIIDNFDIEHHDFEIVFSEEREKCLNCDEIIPENNEIVPISNELCPKCNEMFTDNDGIFASNDGKFEPFEKIGDYLETIEENDATDATVSLAAEPYPDSLQPTTEDGHKDTFETASNDFNQYNFMPKSDVNYDTVEEISTNKDLSEGFSSNQLAVPSTKDMSIKSDTETVSYNISAADSNSTIKLSGTEEISVEKLLKYLRKRNAEYNSAAFTDCVDVD